MAGPEKPCRRISIAFSAARSRTIDRNHDLYQCKSRALDWGVWSFVEGDHIAAAKFDAQHTHRS
jgi:hypothetical protein